MPFFNSSVALSATPTTLTIAGCFQPYQTANVNLQIQPLELAVQNPGTAGLAIASRIMPRGLRVNIFQYPNQGQPIPATNTASLPAGVGSSTNIGEYVVDCGSFVADIVSATANLIPQSRGTSLTVQADVSGIDQANKTVFIQAYNQANGSPTSVSLNSFISFQIILKDTIGV